MALATRRKPSAHLKKRTAGHHRHSKHYLKPYWPYLPMLCILGIALFVNNSWLLEQHSILPISNFSSKNLLNDINYYRDRNQKSNLSVNAQLDTAAQSYANELTNLHSLITTNSSSASPWAYIKNSGYSYRLMGANEAFGFSNAQQAVNAWMNSAMYRENILSSNYQNVGFGIAQTANFQGKGPTTIVVADYGEPASNAPEISFQVPNHINPGSSVKPVPIAAQPVSRFQILSVEPIWVSTSLLVLSAFAVIYIFVKYGIRIRKAAVLSEVFIVEHPLLDIMAVLVISVGYLLTRTSGFIN